MSLSLRQVICTAAVLLATPAGAQTTTELAGNALPEFPHFEYIKAVNANAPLQVAIDPSRFPAVAGQTCDVFVVEAKSASDWAAAPALTDVTPGGAQTETFGATSIQANTFTVTGPSQLNANAGAGLGVGYDVVLDCDRDGVLSATDFIDGGAGEAGVYAVHDITLPGPFGVTEDTYQLDAGVATAYGIPGTRRAQNLFYPTNIGSLGRQPLVVIGHGNGHMFDWYDHIGTHLASYGYVVVSIDNNTGPGPSFAATTQLGHTDAFIEQAELGTLADGDLVGHVDPEKIVWIGHSRGGGGVVLGYNRLVTGAYVPVNFQTASIRLISSMLPTDFFDMPDVQDPHDVNYHLWTASGDMDIASSPADSCCQTYRIHDRADAYRQSTTVQGTGHAWFHNGPESPSVFIGPCSLGPSNDIVHSILKGHLLALVKFYVDGNVPALDFLTRQYERFRPIGVPLESANVCVVVNHEFRNGSVLGNFVIDDFQSNGATGTSSSSGSVTFDVENLTEGLMDDGNDNFQWMASDPFNGAVQAQASSGDSSNGVVFDWSANRFMEWSVPAGARDFTRFKFLSFRGAQGVKHPNTLAMTGDLTFDVTLLDGGGGSSTISTGAYGGGFEEPYDRPSFTFGRFVPEGAPSEMETIRMRVTDFLNNGAGLDLTDVTAIRFEFGPAHGAASGRIMIDDLMLTSDIAPGGFEILEPTMALPAYAGTSTFGSRVLVRLAAAGGVSLAPANLTVSVDGTALTASQIPTAAANVGGETWLVIAPGPRADGCYDLEVALTAPSGVSDTETSSLCYSDADTRIFDRVLAIDKTNSMNRDGTTGVADDAKMQAARAAAKFFVDLSNDSDHLGVIAFQRRDQDDNGSITEPDELAETIFSMVPAVNAGADQRPAARDAIDLVSPDTSPGFTGPETSPGAALDDGRTMLTNDGDAAHEQTIVILTDGLENYPPFWSQPGGGGSPLRPSFLGGDIRIDSIGIGGDADDAILLDMATATGGEFRNLNEGSGSFFLLSRLASWYKAIDEDIRGEQRFFYREGFPKPGPATTHVPPRIGTIPVDDNLDWMTVAFHMNIDHAVSVTLFAPGSATPITAATPDTRVTSDPKHVVYRVTRPTGGLWRYRVDVKEPDAEFFAVASAPTLLAARVGPGAPDRRPSGDYAVPLRVWIADDRAVRGASVTGTIRRPDGVKVGITLLDNGTAGDGAADDGIYGHEYIATVPGAYWVEIVANGTSSTEQPFQRFLSTAFVLPGAEKRPEQPGEGGNTPGGGDPGGPGVSERFVYAAKFLCGKADGETFSAGGYFTGINVRNPEREAVNFRKRFAIAFGQQREGPVSDYVRTKLSGQAAYEIDCPDILQHAQVRDDFLTGFVVIETPVELDVVAVHTVSGRDGFIQSLEVEPITPRRTGGCGDLAVDAIQRPVWDTAARQSVIRAAIRNVGSAPVPATTASASDPSTPDPSGKPYSDDALVPTLDPGESWTAEFRLPYWVYNPDASLVVTADADDTVRECLETNNIARFEDRG